MASKENPGSPDTWPRIRNVISEASGRLRSRRVHQDDGLSIPAHPAIDPATLLPEARPPRDADAVAATELQVPPVPDLRHHGTEPGSRRLPIRPAQEEARRLMVGRGISLSGDIAACEHLVIEGSVAANLANCRALEIAETGFFKGAAVIDTADIGGRFEGDLTVRKRLFVRSTGTVTGTLRYGQLEIERGGRISGDVAAASDPGEREADSAWPGSAQRIASSR